MNTPDQNGLFGEFGGKFVPELLMPALDQLETIYNAAKTDETFLREWRYYLAQYVGRETPLYFAKNMSDALGFRVYLKREDLNHTGAHKINNTIGQALLARRMGKHRIIAETGAGQHGVATATACALLGLKCCVYMGARDIERQKLNVFRMKMMGAEVIPVQSGSQTLKDATNEAIRDWVTTVQDTHYIIGSAIGPHPFPMMVRDFQSVIGMETRKQILDVEGRLPSAVIACVGGGSNAMGMFYPFLNDHITLIGVEASGKGLDTPFYAASIAKGSVGVLHGSKMFLLQDNDGQVQETHSISAGLDYPGVGPEHCFLHVKGQADYVHIGDDVALAAFRYLSETEGIIPALESAHAIGYVLEEKSRWGKDDLVIINLSGRGDKDVATVAACDEGREHA